MGILSYIIIFILNLYGDPNLPRNLLDTVIEFFHKFLHDIFMPDLKKDLMDILKDENISPEATINITSLMHDYGNCFDCVNSEKRRFAILRKKGFHDPQMIEIAASLSPTLKNGANALSFEPINIAWIPLRDSLQDFLEIPEMLTRILDYVDKLHADRNPDIISNIIQGQL